VIMGNAPWFEEIRRARQAVIARAVPVPLI
jgi:hypothetical protein